MLEFRQIVNEVPFSAKCFGSFNGIIQQKDNICKESLKKL
jgi:hypothetical protein